MKFNISTTNTFYKHRSMYPIKNIQYEAVCTFTYFTFWDKKVSGNKVDTCVSCLAPSGVKNTWF